MANDRFVCLVRKDILIYRFLFLRRCLTEKAEFSTFRVLLKNLQKLSSSSLLKLLFRCHHLSEIRSPFCKSPSPLSTKSQERWVNWITSLSTRPHPLPNDLEAENDGPFQYNSGWLSALTDDSCESKCPGDTSVWLISLHSNQSVILMTAWGFWEMMHLSAGWV